MTPLVNLAELYNTFTHDAMLAFIPSAIFFLLASLGFLFNHKYLNISVFGMLISIGAFYGVVFSESKLASNEKLSELSSCTKNVLLIAQEANSPISYRMIENAQTACVEFAKNQEIVTAQREALAENKTK